MSNKHEALTTAERRREILNILDKEGKAGNKPCKKVFHFGSNNTE